MPDTILSLEGETQGPKYRRVANAIETAIARGTLKPGDRLPPVRELAWSLRITPGTVARAYSILTESGKLVAEVGRGTFVAEGAPPQQEVWWGKLAPQSDGSKISLASPQLPDVGQVAAIRRAFAKVGERDPARLLQYPTRDGFRHTRKVVAEWLRHAQLGTVDEQDVVLTHGGQHGLCVTLQSLLRGPKPVILVEELAYPGFRRAAEILRAEVISVPLDGEGIIPSELERIARRHSAQVLCTSPDVQNPTLAFTPETRRLEIAAICDRLDLQIIEDDCYQMTSGTAPSYRLLAPERAWHIASISKTLTPALRAGFAIAPPGKGPALRQVAEFGFFGLSQPIAEVLETLLSDPHTHALQQAIRDRMAEYVHSAVNTLGAYDVVWNSDVPFLWLRLPEGWRASSFCRAAETHDIHIRTADEFALRDGHAPHAVRIAINAQLPLARFESAMRQLLELLQHPPERIAV